jgi:hypothetical protein
VSVTTENEQDGIHAVYLNRGVICSEACSRKFGMARLLIRCRADRSYLSHNKFIILLKDGKSIEVWTGSTNFTESGIYGQSNVGYCGRAPDFADASTIRNDENMLVIKGNTWVADIYFGEFMRLFDYFRFRDVMNRLAARSDSDMHKSAFLTPDDSWLKPYYTTGSYKALQRKLFT